MNPIIGYDSPEKTCHAIQSVTKSQFPKLVARPYNTHEPETTFWWLVPSSEWPAYKYGKMYFKWVDDSNPTAIWVGFHTEKGLDASVSAACSTPSAARHIMRDDWHWFDFLRHLTSGDFPNTVKTVASETRIPLQVRLTAHLYGDLLKLDEYIFEWNPQSSALHRLSVKRDADRLRPLEQILAFDELAQYMNLLTSDASDPWLWVNLTFVVPFALCTPARAGEGDVWRAPEIWSNYLRRFRHFWF